MDHRPISETEGTGAHVHAIDACVGGGKVAETHFSLGGTTGNSVMSVFPTSPGFTMTGSKVVGCYDAAFGAIPNQ